MVGNLEKDFKKQVEDYEFKQNYQKQSNEKLELELVELEKSYQAKHDTLYRDSEITGLNKQVEEL